VLIITFGGVSERILNVQKKPGKNEL